MRCTITPLRPSVVETATTKQYACLVPDCTHVEPFWRKARKHMAIHGYVGRPKLKASQAKADLLNPAPQPHAADPFKGNLLTSYAPSKEELMQIVVTSKDSEHALNIIKDKYGNFPFNTFGYGTFQAFCCIQ